MLDYLEFEEMKKIQLQLVNEWLPLLMNEKEFLKKQKFKVQDWAASTNVGKSVENNIENTSFYINQTIEDIYILNRAIDTAFRNAIGNGENIL